MEWLFLAGFAGIGYAGRMSDFTRVTLGKAVEASGIGVHSGAMARVVLRPAEAGHGIVFVRDDAGKARFDLHPDMVQAMPMCTLLKNHEDVTLSTVEHLMAAFAGLGVTDALVEVEGPELPILDGSALPWVELIDNAGRVPLHGTVAPLVVKDALLQEDKGRRLSAVPADVWSVAVEIDFPHPAIGAQSFGGVVTEAWFRREIAPARTFIVEKDLKVAQAYGMAKGAALDGGVLFLDDGRVANSEGLRFPDEPVRHKVLDAMGDLYVAGRPLRGRFDRTAPGHAANNRLLRALLAA